MTKSHRWAETKAGRERRQNTWMTVHLDRKKQGKSTSKKSLGVHSHIQVWERVFVSLHTNKLTVCPSHDWSKCDRTITIHLGCKHSNCTWLLFYPHKYVGASSLHSQSTAKKKKSVWEIQTQGWSCLFREELLMEYVSISSQRVSGHILEHLVRAHASIS